MTTSKGGWTYITTTKSKIGSSFLRRQESQNMPMLNGLQSENKYKDFFSTQSHNLLLRRNDGKEREKLIKGWLRQKKVAMIESMNSYLPKAGRIERFV